MVSVSSPEGSAGKGVAVRQIEVSSAEGAEADPRLFQNLELVLPH